MRQDLTALKSFTYAGRALKAGDPFNASRRDARVLEAVGKAGPAGEYQTTAAAPEVTKGQEAKLAAKKVAAKKASSKKAEATDK